MFSVSPIPAFHDNYIWLLRQENSADAVVVDPGDATPVLEALDNQQLRLTAILITHHHADHTGGVEQLLRRFDVPVYGPAGSPFSGISHPLKDSDQFRVLGQELSVREVPGHTLDHISYCLYGEQPQLFCGDTLFLAGCGRLFEGTAEQMLKAMKFFAALPDHTEIYCTHEYSLANLAFAATVEPDNQAITATIGRCEELRRNAQPTLPSTIATEKQINPFLRTACDSVQRAASQHSGTALHSEQAVFSAIRDWKNNF